ncbi:MspA family porin [Nocardia sp. NPDC057353]|uniref:MspA family porin n=1 Tax=Nocardia sp. NPDC057353 TaxID=3346104 RepID=UPI003636DFF9
MTNYRTAAVRVAGAGAVAAVAMGLFSTGAADADTFVPLPDGQKLGPGVTVSRTGEHAIVSPSLAANGAGRVVWVSGNAVADVTATPEGEVGPFNGPANEPGSNNSSTHGASQLNTGYIVGCQVSISDEAISAELAGGLGLTLPFGGSEVVPDGAFEGAIGLDLGPGEVKFVQIEIKDITEPGIYSVEYQDVEIAIQGCAGYAQARAYTVVEIIGDNYSKTSLYGMPFSIG